MIKHGKQAITVHTYINGVLQATNTHNRMVYEDANGKWINWGVKRYLEADGTLHYKIQEIQTITINDILKRAIG